MRSSGGRNGGECSECSKIKVCLGKVYIGHVILSSYFCDARSNGTHVIRFVRHNVSLGMKNFKDTFMSFFAGEDIQRDIKAIVKTMGVGLYNELYMYIWFICIYNVLLLFLVCVNLFLLYRSLGLREFRILPDKYLV